MINLDLDNPERIVEVVPGDGIAWEATGTASEVAVWLGNCSEADRVAIRLACRQESAQGRALRITYPSVMTFVLGYDFDAHRFRLYVPAAMPPGV